MARPLYCAGIDPPLLKIEMPASEITDEIYRRARRLAWLDWVRPDRHRNGLKYGCPFAKGDFEFKTIEDCRCPRIIGLP